jgi:SAM-dependent methyltransferase
MHTPPDLTDRTALARNRRRALAGAAPALFLHDQAIDEIQQRLKLVNRTFTAPVIIAPFGEIWSQAVPGAAIVGDDDILDLQAGAHDLVIHAMALHWANDPVGQLVQARRALRPDGLFLGIFFGGRTLHELRAALSAAEVAVTGGLSPRVAPMGDIRDLGSLLQRAGFALPVADALSLRVAYRSARHLMHDLRAMGEANALATRNRAPLRRAILQEAERQYQTLFKDDDGISATFELIVLTGWAPSPDQPKPLRPGSASARLADALKTEERALDDPARPDRA